MVSPSLNGSHKMLRIASEKEAMGPERDNKKSRLSKQSLGRLERKDIRILLAGMSAKWDQQVKQKMEEEVRKKQGVYDRNPSTLRADEGMDELLVAGEEQNGIIVQEEEERGGAPMEKEVAFAASALEDSEEELEEVMRGFGSVKLGVGETEEEVGKREKYLEAQRKGGSSCIPPNFLAQKRVSSPSFDVEDVSLEEGLPVASRKFGKLAFHSK